MNVVGMLFRKFISALKFIKLLSVALIAYVMPRKRKKIVFGAWFGRKYDCNPKALFEYILDKDPSFECIWVGEEGLRTSVLTVPGAKFARKGSLLATWHCLTTSFYVSNIDVGMDIGTTPYCGRVKILHLGHGVAGKCCGVKQLDGQGNLKTTACKRRFLVTRLIEWMYPPQGWRSSCSPFEGQILLREFPTRLAPERILPFGYCRNDFLVNNKSNEILKRNLKEKISKLIGVDPGKRWYLYAPTWRHDNDRSFSFLQSPHLVELNRLLVDKDAILLEKLHPKTLHELNMQGGAVDRVVQLSALQSSLIDIPELLLATDLMISDYSSIYFDFSLLGRPVIEYTYDYDYAQNVDFGFEFDLREYAPGPFVYTETELLTALKKTDEDLLADRTEKFNGYLINERGEACSKVFEFIVRASGAKV